MSGGPGLAGTRMSPFWTLLELRTMEVVMTTGAIRRARLLSNRHHQQTSIPVFLQARCPSCRPTNSVRALTGKLNSLPASFKAVMARSIFPKPACCKHTMTSAKAGLERSSLFTGAGTWHNTKSDQTRMQHDQAFI